jgi:hypothetical protein
MVKDNRRLAGEELPEACKNARFIKLVAAASCGRKWRNPAPDETCLRDGRHAAGNPAAPQNKTGTANAVPVCKTCLDETAA